MGNIYINIFLEFFKLLIIKKKKKVFLLKLNYFIIIIIIIIIINCLHLILKVYSFFFNLFNINFYFESLLFKNIYI